MNLCLQDTLVHGSAVGTATPKHPKIRYSQMQSGKSVIIAVGTTHQSFNQERTSTQKFYCLWQNTSKRDAATKKKAKLCFSASLSTRLLA